MTFEKWFLASPHRAKYDSASPAYLAAREAWKAAKRDALLELNEWCLYEERRLHGEREFEYKVGVDIVRDEIKNRVKELE